MTDQTEKLNKIKETINEAIGVFKNDKDLQKKAISLSVIVLILLLFSSFLFSENAPQVKKQSKGTIFKGNNLPEGYFHTNPIPEKIIEVKEIIKEIYKEPEKFLNPKNIFNERKPSISTISDLEQARETLLKNRLNKAKIINFPKDDIDNSDFTTKKETIDISRADDFSEHKLKKSIPTYPVDLSRTLTTDNKIPIVLEVDINSELSSSAVIAHVTRNVYAAIGNKILIPQGSKAYGMYDGLETKVSSRLQINWTRILTPEGINIKLTTETADVTGQSGVTGELDKRIFESVEKGVYYGLVSVIPTLAISTNNANQAKAAEAFSSQFASPVEQSLSASINDIKPILKIPYGTKLLISSRDDIWFKPPKLGTVEIVILKEGVLPHEK